MDVPIVIQEHMQSSSNNYQTLNHTWSEKNPWETNNSAPLALNFQNRLPILRMHEKRKWDHPKEPRGGSFFDTRDLRPAWDPCGARSYLQRQSVLTHRDCALRARAGVTDHKQDDRWRRRARLSCVNHTKLRPDCTYIPAPKQKNSSEIVTVGIWPSHFVVPRKFRQIRLSAIWCFQFGGTNWDFTSSPKLCGL